LCQQTGVLHACRFQRFALMQQVVAATDSSCLDWWVGGSFLLSVMVQVLGTTGGLFLQHACVIPHQTASSCTVLPSAPCMTHISAVQLRQWLCVYHAVPGIQPCLSGFLCACMPISCGCGQRLSGFLCTCVPTFVSWVWPGCWLFVCVTVGPAPLVCNLTSPLSHTACHSEERSALM
jgi:hypothetical protein